MSVERILGECFLISSLPALASRTSLVNLISKEANLVFYSLSVYKLIVTVQTIDYDVIIDFRVDSMSLTTSFK